MDKTVIFQPGRRWSADVKAIAGNYARWRIGRTVAGTGPA
jgi:hypothetical protein